MPLDVLGRTRATLMKSTSSFPLSEDMGNLLKLHRAGDRALQLLLFNEESLVSTSHQLVLITSLPFCTHRPSLLPIEWLSETLGLTFIGCKRLLSVEKLVKLGHLEEVKVVTRFP